MTDLQTVHIKAFVGR
uniref:Uncharacterized protein n=1 Tax=Anguilla anguilla TaxID=7936 RepID=A0A0E9VBY3_ANGAN